MSIIDNDKIKQYEELHRKDPSYGSSSLKFISEISVVIEHLKPKTILDYGCGKGALISELEKRYPEIQCLRYDPSMPDYNVLPARSADMIINTDVLEHVPERDIDDILQEIASISSHVYFNLHHARAATVLPSGENAHCTIKTPRWYRRKIKKYFKDVTILPGRRYISSVAVTFPVTESVRRDYMKIVDENRVPTTFNLRLRYFVKNLLKDWFGVKMNK